jgi:hypothetical protein
MEVSSGSGISSRVEVLKKKGGGIYIHGATTAATTTIQRELRKHFKRGRFRPDRAKSISSLLVRAIRSAASTKFGQTIGRDCITAVIRRDKPKQIICESHHERETAFNYTPLMVVLPGIWIGGFAVGTDKGPVPVTPTGDIFFGSAKDQPPM